MSTGNVVVRLGVLTQQINRYAPIFLLLLGTFGNLLNCLIFTRRTLRTNPCSVYFLVASLGNLIVFLTAFIPQIIDGWNPEVNLKETVSALCKILLFTLFTSRCIVAWVLALATVDRYFISSPNIHRRQMSNLKNTYRCIILTCTVMFVVWIEVIFCFDANIVGSPLKCSLKSKACRIYNDVAQGLIIITIPMVIMLVFGFCAIRNVKSRRVVSNNINDRAILRNRRSENSLTKMLLTQVLILTLLSLPLAIMACYLSITFYQDKSSVQRAIENFLFIIFLLFAYTPNCISFFLYTLSGSLFRKTFIDLRKKIIRYLTCNH